MERTARARLSGVLALMIGWLACVGGAARGLRWLGPAAAALIAGRRVAAAVRPLRELRRIAAVVFFGVAVESAALHAGLYGYAGGWAVWWLPPAWVAALWLLLGSELASRPGRSSGPRLAAAGALGGALHFALMTRLGVAGFIVPTPVGLAAVSAVWAALLPMTAFVLRYASM